MSRTACPHGMFDTCCENYDNCNLDRQAIEQAQSKAKEQAKTDRFVRQLDEAIKAAEVLEALEDVGVLTDREWQAVHKNKANELRQAIAEAEKHEVSQEPVAWLHWLHSPVRLFLNKDEAMMELYRLNREYPVDKDKRQMRPLYTHPPKREPLTDEQKIVLGFLDGSNALQSVWFGDDHPLIKKKYWWRRFLRQAFADEFAAHGIKEKNT